MPTQPADQVVDGTGTAWYAARYPDGRTVYLPGPGLPHHGTPRTLDEITPPVRPVGPAAPDTVETFRFTVRRLVGLRPLRHRLIGTVCAALADAAAEAGPAYPLVFPAPRTSHEDALAAMAHQLGPDIHTEPDRYEPLARETLTELILEWITGPDRYTVPAPTLAALLAAPVALAGGWAAVTDEKLRACPQAGLLSWYVRSRIEDPPCSR